MCTTERAGLDDGDLVSRQALVSAFEEAPIGMAVLTPEGVITHYNAALGELLAQPDGALLGRTFFERTHPDDLPQAWENCRRMQAGTTRIVRHECRFVGPGGALLWVMVSTSRPAAVPGRLPHLIMHIEDITARKALEAELLRRALHDPLTDLPNRALLLDRLGHALARSSRTARPLCLFYLDLDGFKAVNDTHGHRAGDELLRQFAQRVTALLRPGDTAARLGGDEFAVLCEDTDAGQADLIAARLHAAAAAPFALGGGREVVIGASLGVGLARPGHDDPSDAAELLAAADLRMYEAKRRTG